MSSTAHALGRGGDLPLLVIAGNSTFRCERQAVDVREMSGPATALLTRMLVGLPRQEFLGKVEPFLIPSS